ncbi:MAG: hypothetical protein LH609_07340, partial [Rudanella sp.]|nr:hypothetical protein [Rudanella sp.]
RPLWGSPTKYAAFDQGGSSQGAFIGNWSVFQTNPNILIYRSSPGNVEYQSDEIFSTTCHETAHLTHILEMNAGAIQFLQVSARIRESWAIGVEWLITQMEYRERGIPNDSDPFYNVNAGFPTRFAHQNWRYGMQGGTLDDYTCLFIDLVDNHNQAGQFGGITTLTDNVSGYSLATIESTMLKHVYGIGSLRDELKNNKAPGVTDAQIDELINQF